MVDIVLSNTPFNGMLDLFEKTLTYTPYTKTLNSLSGDETLTAGTASSISGCLFMKEDFYRLAESGLIQDADAILLVKSDVTISKNDTITYASITWRIDTVRARQLGTTIFYYFAKLFKV